MPNERGYASCHASFGELLQGALPEVGSFLVTLPIELHTRARFVASAVSHELAIEPARALSVEPESSWKARRLAEALLRRYGLPLRGELTLDSEIPRGKGLASSTADLVATYRAIANCYDLPAEVEVLEALLRDIEPSDGVMHDGVVAYAHRDVRLLERLGSVPSLALVAVDEGGEVETLAHNDRAPGYLPREIDEFARLLVRLRQALHCGDVASIGAVATRSAELNQRLLPKRSFGAMIDVAANVNALGVVATHSGTCLAILIDASHAGRDEQIHSTRERLTSLGLQPITLMTLQSHATLEPAHA